MRSRSTTARVQTLKRLYVRLRKQASRVSAYCSNCLISVHKKLCRGNLSPCRIMSRLAAEEQRCSKDQSSRDRSPYLHNSLLLDKTRIFCSIFCAACLESRGDIMRKVCQSSEAIPSTACRERLMSRLRTLISEPS